MLISIFTTVDLDFETTLEYSQGESSEKKLAATSAVAAAAAAAAVERDVRKMEIPAIFDRFDWVSLFFFFLPNFQTFVLDSELKMDQHFGYEA